MRGLESGNKLGPIVVGHTLKLATSPKMATHHKVAIYIHQHLYSLPFKYKILYFSLR
jgi:hypothetical protein